MVFPELSLTGYGLEGLADPERWVSAADPRLDGLREICRRTGITAVVGAPFREADGTPRLASLALHPTGELEAGFKVWLHGAEQQSFRPGDRTVILDLDGWKIALAICLDAARPVMPARRRRQAPTSMPSRPSTPPARTTGWPCTSARAPWTTGCSACWPTSAAPPNSAPRPAGADFWGPDGRVIRQAAGTGTEVLTATLQHDVLDRYADERHAMSRPGPHPAGRTSG